MALYGCFIEIAGHYQGKDGARLLRTLADLRESSINGHRVTAVSRQQCEPATKVPDFGHNAQCRCETPEPYGVMRYFGIDVVTDELAGDEDLGAYVVNEYARVFVCGFSTPSDKPRRELARIY